MNHQSFPLKIPTSGEKNTTTTTTCYHKTSNYSHYHCRLCRCTSARGQRRAAQNCWGKTALPGSSTGKPGHNPPGRGMREQAGSSSRLAWLRSQCCGRHGEPSAEPFGSPEQKQKIAQDAVSKLACNKLFVCTPCLDVSSPAQGQIIEWCM